VPSTTDPFVPGCMYHSCNDLTGHRIQSISIGGRCSANSAAWVLSQLCHL